jgi:5-methylcytosine-specific restriction enzyme A
MMSSNFYRSKEWYNTRDMIRLRDKGICQTCGKFILPTTRSNGRTMYGIVDHIIDYKLRPDLALEPTNLVLLCLPCHNTKTFNKEKIKNKLEFFEKIKKNEKKINFEEIKKIKL